MSAGFDANHFTYLFRIANRNELYFFRHIFIDEAGQSTEPETLIPLSGLCHFAGKARTSESTPIRIVIVGDPQQLGPVIMSALSKDRGLGK